jgi:hypothetical protein
VSALQELFIVLQRLGDGSLKLLANGPGGDLSGIFVGEEAAKKVADEWETFQAFPLNSAEAFEAIHGEKGIDFSKGLLPVESDRFRLAVEPLMRYMSHTHHPHTRVIVDSTSAELLEGMAVHRTDKFLVD